jgi:hypothetical protein
MVSGVTKLTRIKVLSKIYFPMKNSLGYLTTSFALIFFQKYSFMLSHQLIIIIIITNFVKMAHLISMRSVK